MTTPSGRPVVLFNESGQRLPLDYLLRVAAPRKQDESTAEYEVRFQKVKQAFDTLSAAVREKARANAGPQGLSTDDQIRLSVRVTEIARKTCSLPGCGHGIYADGTTLQKCAQCHDAMYCGREHQRIHWPQHRLACRIPTPEVE